MSRSHQHKRRLPDGVASDDDGISWEDVASLKQHHIAYQEVKHADVLYLTAPHHCHLKASRAA